MKMPINTKKMEIDNTIYKLEVRENAFQDDEATRILIPAFLKNKTAAELTRICIDSIIKYTEEPYELWYIDNNSPQKFTEWLDQYPQINIIFNKTEPVNPFRYRKGYMKKRDQTKDASYANAIGLELGCNVIKDTAKFVFVMHSDILITKNGWLKFLKSKLNEKIKAIGIRKDRIRVHALHVGGLFFDFSLFKKLEMSFLPNIKCERYPNRPEYDVGDDITIKLKENNFGVFTCKNTFNDIQLNELIPPNNPIKELKCDKAFDDTNEIFYLHLGRGAPKSFGKYKRKNKLTAEQWIDFAKNYIL